MLDVLKLSVYWQVIKACQDGVHDVAIKVAQTDLSAKELLKEISILRNCRHSNIVQVRRLLLR